MPVLLDSIPDLGITCQLWYDRVTKADALGIPAQVDLSNPMFGGRWIAYFDSSADLSELDAPTLLELRDRLRPVVAELSARGEFTVLQVSNSVYLDPLLNIWRTIVGTDPD